MIHQMSAKRCAGSGAVRGSGVQAFGAKLVAPSPARLVACQVASTQVTEASTVVLDRPGTTILPDVSIPAALNQEIREGHYEAALVQEQVNTRLPSMPIERAPNQNRFVVRDAGEQSRRIAAGDCLRPQACGPCGHGRCHNCWRWPCWSVPGGGAWQAGHERERPG